MTDIVNTMRVDVADLIEGLEVRVVGRARPSGPQLVAKGGVTCLAYAIHAVLDGYQARSLETEPTVFMSEFAIDDGTGRVVIEADAAARFDVEAHAVADEPHAFGASILAREAAAAGSRTPLAYLAVVRDGDLVAVRGTVTRGPGSSLRLRGPLVVSTKPAALA